MKIVSWNCNGKFREKFKAIQEVNADIYVIQECEDPATTKSIDYQHFARNHLWVGHSNKGLGIFGKESILLANNDWDTYGLEYFLSCRVANQFDLLAIWACGAYIEDIYVYLQIHKEHITENCIICGDFNSNAIWDKQHGRKSHTAVVSELRSKGLNSYYHIQSDEGHGKESIATFYLQRNKSKPYHIDYSFASNKYLGTMDICNEEHWLKYSDHIPLVFDVIMDDIQAALH